MLIRCGLSGISNHREHIDILFMLYCDASVKESITTALVHDLHHRCSSQTGGCEKRFH